MAQQLFKEFVILFKNWPVDATKAGRCLGEHIRKKFNQNFRQGELSNDIDVNYWSKLCNDLKPIANNEYRSKYQRERSFGALGLGKEQCKLAISNTALKFLGENSNKN